MGIDSIKLIKIEVTENEIGDVIDKTIEKELIAELKSVRSSEFYQAAAVGFKPEIVFVIWKFDYEKEKKIIYQNIEYNIIRTYERIDEKIELTCTSQINNEVNAYGNT